MEREGEREGGRAVIKELWRRTTCGEGVGQKSREVIVEEEMKVDAWEEEEEGVGGGRSGRERGEGGERKVRRRL